MRHRTSALANTESNDVARWPRPSWDDRRYVCDYRCDDKVHSIAKVDGRSKVMRWSLRDTLKVEKHNREKDEQVHKSICVCFGGFSFISIHVLKGNSITRASFDFLYVPALSGWNCFPDLCSSHGQTWAKVAFLRTTCAPLFKLVERRYLASLCRFLTVTNKKIFVGNGHKRTSSCTILGHKQIVSIYYFSSWVYFGHAYPISDQFSSG